MDKALFKIPPKDVFLEICCTKTEMNRSKERCTTKEQKIETNFSSHQKQTY